MKVTRFEMNTLCSYTETSKHWKLKYRRPVCVCLCLCLTLETCLSELENYRQFKASEKHKKIQAHQMHCPLRCFDVDVMYNVTNVFWVYCMVFSNFYLSNSSCTCNTHLFVHREAAVRLWFVCWICGVQHIVALETKSFYFYGILRPLHWYFERVYAVNPMYKHSDKISTEERCTNAYRGIRRDLCVKQQTSIPLIFACYHGKTFENAILADGAHEARITRPWPFMEVGLLLKNR